MKRVRFTEEQIIGVLREHEAGAKTADLARKHGISEKQPCTTGRPSTAAWMCRKPSGCGHWKDQNRKLKKLLAELMLDNAALKESGRQKNGKGPVAKREAVAHLRGVLEMSERRACSLVAADRKMIRYRSRRPPDRELRARLRELANQRRRFGYRRLFILPRDEGEPSGVNRIYRLYREEGLAVRKRRKSPQGGGNTRANPG